MARTKKPKTVTVSTYSSQITAKKALIELMLVLASAGLAWGIDSLIPQLVEEYPQYFAIFTIIIVLLRAAQNYIKHYKDTEEVPI